MKKLILECILIYLLINIVFIGGLLGIVWLGNYFPEYGEAHINFFGGDNFPTFKEIFSRLWIAPIGILIAMIASTFIPENKIERLEE